VELLWGVDFHRASANKIQDSDKMKARVIATFFTIMVINQKNWQEDGARYKDQRDAALEALDAMQQETKESHLRANRLSSNFDQVESELDDLRAQRNAGVPHTSLTFLIILR
jgi:hypothetical protein